MTKTRSVSNNKQDLPEGNIHPKFQTYTDTNGVKHIAKNRTNLSIALSALGINPSFNEFAKRMRIEGLEGGVFTDRRPDAARRHIRLKCEEIGFKMGAARFNELFDEIGEDNSFNPLTDYLDALEWDGKARVDTWLIDYLGAEDTELNRNIGRIVLTAAVRRARKPGTKFDNAMVLEGRQGSLKSTAVASLVPYEEMFTDNVTVSMDTKQIIEQTEGVWIAEFAELSGMSKSEVEGVKHMLSKTEDRARMSYERYRSEHPRQFIFIGTTNGEGYLRDDTGNRRFWPVRTSQIDPEAVRRDRDQLWAEASILEANGESITLDPSLWDAAAEQQEQRREENPFVEPIIKELRDHRFAKTEITGAEIYDMLKIDVDKRHTGNGRMIADAMRRLGCESKRKTVRDGHSTTKITIYDVSGLTGAT